MLAETTRRPVADLKETVHVALTRTAVLAGKNLRFEVQEDSVVLRGIVRSYYQKQLVQESLRTVSGVSRITNELEVVAT